MWSAILELGDGNDCCVRVGLDCLDMASQDMIMRGGKEARRWWNNYHSGDVSSDLDERTDGVVDDAGGNLTADNNKPVVDKYEALLDKFVSSDDSAPSDGDAERDADDEEEIPAEQILEKMVGLRRVKEEVADARLMALFMKEREDMGFHASTDCRNHMIFLGNPGTGKTTVAKLIGKMYNNMGLLSSGHTIVTNRSELIGQYIGQTEQKTREVISSARGGVLFIDEAYSLVSGQLSNDFGKEVINSLLVVLSEPDPDMIVILAGYSDKMQELLDMNPGLRDRFPLHIHFDDYTADELMEIARGVCRDMNLELSPAADARLRSMMVVKVGRRDKLFGNGRWVHNLIEHGVLKNMARRVMAVHDRADNARLYNVIEESDVAKAEPVFVNDAETKPMLHPRIGFVA